METPPVLLLIFAMKILQNKIVSSERGRKFEIGRILHLKSEIRNRKLDCLGRQVQSDIRDFGFEMQDSSNFKMSSPD